MVLPRQGGSITFREMLVAAKAFFSGHLFGISEREKFENEFAEYIGVKYAVAFSSARIAELAILRSLDIKEGSEIIVPAYTHHSVPQMVRFAGFRPVFVDVDPATYNLKPEMIEQKISPLTRAIIMTHIGGQPCDVDGISTLARKYNLYIIEDCAQACGSEYKGKKVGSLGHAAYFSFNASKNMTCLGGGALVTSDENIFRNLQGLLKTSSSNSKRFLITNTFFPLFVYIFTRPFIFTFTVFPFLFLQHLFKSSFLDSKLKQNPVAGKKATAKALTRMGSLQACIGRGQLRRLDAMNEARIRYSAILTEALKGCRNISLQQATMDAKNTFLFFYVQVPFRREVRARLAFSGIDAEEDGLSYPEENGAFISFPVARQLVESNIVLPNFSYLGQKRMKAVAKKIKLVINQTQKKHEDRQI